MISLEILIENPIEPLPLGAIAIGHEMDYSLKSDRSPSLWQNVIINNYPVSHLIHLFDRSFKGTKGPRWLYDDITEKEWKRFRFLDKLEDDFCRLIRIAVGGSKVGRVWIMADAQYGPAPKLYSDQSEAAFLTYYLRFGLRLNSAIRVTGRSGIESQK